MLVLVLVLLLLLLVLLLVLLVLLLVLLVLLLVLLVLLIERVGDGGEDGVELVLQVYRQRGARAEQRLARAGRGLVKG